LTCYTDNPRLTTVYSSVKERNLDSGRWYLGQRKKEKRTQNWTEEPMFGSVSFPVPAFINSFLSCISTDCTCTVAPSRVFTQQLSLNSYSLVTPNFHVYWLLSYCPRITFQRQYNKGSYKFWKKPKCHYYYYRYTATVFFSFFYGFSLLLRLEYLTSVRCKPGWFSSPRLIYGR
jgi:hypothetical protein